MARGSRLRQDLARDGGFSESLAGTKPVSGILVSQAGSEEVKPGLATDVEIDSYDQRHQTDLASRGRYFGGWVDDDQTYLDVSQRFPIRPGREVADTQSALNALAANQQLAGYDASTGSFPEPEPTLFPLTPNIDPVRIKYRNRALMGHGSIFGEAARRKNAPVQGELF